MKSTVKLAETAPKKEYPCLKICNTTNIIILFTSPEKGTVVNSGNSNNYPIGYYSSFWAMSPFKPFEGEITLSN